MAISHQMSDTAQLLDQLKRLYKASGLRYADVADRIGVCHKTIKRYMAGRGLTLATLENLCRVIDISVLDLAEFVTKERDEPNYMSQTQEDALGEDLVLGLIFFLLSRGWCPQDVATEFNIPESDLNYALTRLDRLGIIALYPENRVKILAKTCPDLRTGRRAKQIWQLWRRVMIGINIDDPDLIWHLGLARLSPDSLPMVSKMYEEFLKQVYAIGEQDRNRAPGNGKWYQLPMCVLPYDLKKIGIEGSFEDGHRLRRTRVLA